jgi:membrane protease YdiL (CAAX protease family)
MATTVIKGATLVTRLHGALWLVIPAALVAGAIIPTWLGKRDFPRIGIDRGDMGTAFLTVGCTCACVLPIALLGLLLLTSLQWPIPLRPVIEGPWNWLSWSLHQFLYVAVAEEVFFRGYVQANAASLLGRARWPAPSGRQWAEVFVSAACFALAHAVVQGQIMSVATFLPGIVLAWLFMRTRTLLAPILFHGVANLAYGIMAAIVAA